MAKKRRFSINEAEAQTVIKALKMALNQIYRMDEESPYLSWTKAEMETLQFRLETYNFNKEDEGK